VGGDRRVDTTERPGAVSEADRDDVEAMVARDDRPATASGRAARGGTGGGGSPSAGKPPAEPPEDAPARGWGLPLAVLIVGMFMSVLDTSIVNVAIPVIQKEFGVSAADAQWISTSYSLTEGIMVPISAWVGNRIGAKRLYIWSLALFTVASALCGMSDNLPFMIFFRFAQGIPGGMIPVTCLLMLTRMVPKERFGTAMGLYGLGVVVAPAVGPSLGGYFSEYFSWRLVYYVNVPIGILGVAAAIIVLKGWPGRREERFDALGFACIAGAFLALLLVIEEGPDWGWTSFPILILAAVAVDLFVLFAIVESQVEHPLVRLGIFRNTQFNLSLILITVFSVAIFAEFFYIPQFLQGSRDYSPMQAGLALMPQALALVVLMPITGRLYDRFGPRWLAVLGLALTAAGLFILAGLSIEMTDATMVLGMTTMGTGLGVGMMPVMTGGLATLSPDLADSGGSFNTLVQRVSQALGLGSLSALVAVDRGQFMNDRSALAYDMAAQNPQVEGMRQQGEAGLLPMWTQLSGMVQGQVYANVFYAVGWLTLASIVLALFLPSGRPTGGQAVAH
jgi:EmrB/QacA subfamily drug resistance transporter